MPSSPQSEDARRDASRASKPATHTDITDTKTKTTSSSPSSSLPPPPLPATNDETRTSETPAKEGGEVEGEDPLEDGEVEPSGAAGDDAPPPPLPGEPVPSGSDDGWSCQWDARTQAWFFYNRFTGRTQWENPRHPGTSATTNTVAGAGATTTTTTTSSSAPLPPLPPRADEKPAAGGYNPAIHGDYDPEAWYAKNDGEGGDGGGGGAADAYATTAAFSRFKGGAFRTDDEVGNRHSDEAKARRQMNAYFDTSAASAAHDGRSLRAERQSRKPSKAEVKAFKERRKAKKEEKRRAWLRD